jgi:hypothetical protein
MYNDFTFAEVKPPRTFNNVNEALQHSLDVTVTPIPATVEDIQITSKGHVMFQGNEKLIPSKGIESFFSILGIPPQFSRRIPTDLLLHNVDKLTKDIPAQPIFVLERPDGNIASIVRSPYTEIPYSDIIGRFENRPIKSIEISESLLKIIFTFESLKVPDLDDNQDTLYVGEFLTSSITKLLSLQVTAGLYRMQCENSFIMNILGKLVANYMKKEDIRLERFAEAFECYNSDVVATVFRNFAAKRQTALKEHQVKQVWERISNIFSKSDADLLFGFDEDQRNSIINSGKSYLSDVKRAEKLGLELPKAYDTPFSYYKIANEITTAAHTRMFDPVDQIKAEVVGGNILQWMIFQN